MPGDGMQAPLSKTRVEKMVVSQCMDSRSNPTVSVGLISSRGRLFTFTVDSGASTGKNEAVELRDGEKAFDGKGVSKALDNAKRYLAPLVEGVHLSTPQKAFDQRLCEADGTGNLSRLGANAILPVSAAYARMRADAMGVPLHEYLNYEAGGDFCFSVPVPFMNVFNAGKHASQAKGSFPGQEIMIGAVGAKSAAQAIGMGVETWRMMRTMLKERKLPVSIGDEGGFANPFSTAGDSFEFIKEAVIRAGFEWGRQIALAVDPAASEYFGKEVHQEDKDVKGRKYHFELGQLLSPSQMGGFWAGMAREYPIISLEDIHAQNDYAGWRHSTGLLGKQAQLVGDDVFCTNKKLLKMGMKKGLGNAILIKLNQNGTVDGTLEVMRYAMENGYRCMVSHRSGLGMDDFIADLSLLSGQIKAGSSRERMLIYNRIALLEQAYTMQSAGMGTFTLGYAGMSAFSPEVQAFWKEAWGK